MNAPALDTEVASPCTGVCQLGSRGHCRGCGRVIDEITAWSRANHAQKRLIRERAAQRLVGDPEAAPRP